MNRLQVSANGRHVLEQHSDGCWYIILSANDPLLSVADKLRDRPELRPYVEAILHHGTFAITPDSTVET